MQCQFALHLKVSLRRGRCLNTVLPWFNFITERDGLPRWSHRNSGIKMYDTSLPLNLTRRPGEMEDFQKGGTNDVYTDCLQRDEMISNYLETQSLYEASRCRMPALTHVSEEGKATGMNSQPKVVDSAGPCRLSTSNNSYYSTPWSTTMYPRPVYPVYIGESLSPHSHPSNVPSSCMYQRDLCQNFRNYAANQWIQGYQGRAAD